MLVVADHNPARHIRFAYVNWGLMIACVLVFILRIPWDNFAFTPAHLHLIGGVKAPGGAPEILGTMVSYIFLHGTPIHLAGNMLALWVFGDNIEDSMGHWRYALFFLLCGMGGAGAEALFSNSPMVPVIGASGAIAGVMGAYLLLHPRARVLVLVAFRVPVLVPGGGCGPVGGAGSCCCRVTRHALGGGDRVLGPYRRLRGGGGVDHRAQAPRCALDAAAKRLSRRRVSGAGAVRD
nr:rhomboid family intramembrane serine protease [Pararhodobacter sp.]